MNLPRFFWPLYCHKTQEPSFLLSFIQYVAFLTDTNICHMQVIFWKSNVWKSKTMFCNDSIMQTVFLYLFLAIDPFLDEDYIHTDICWRELKPDTTCINPMLGVSTTYTECCCLYGIAWGSQCAFCPEKSSGGFLELFLSIHGSLDMFSLHDRTHLF